MEKEADTTGKHNPIRSISSRIKLPLSINRKLRNRGMPLTTKSIMENLHDVAGVRIICEYLSDVNKVRDNLLADGFMELFTKYIIKEACPGTGGTMAFRLHQEN